MAAFRATNCLKSMVGQLRRVSTTSFATSTSPKMKAYSPASDADHHHNFHPDTKPRPVKGEFIPVYVSLGFIGLSLSLGLFTVVHQLSRAPNVFVKKSRRETLPELVEPDKVVDQADQFIKKSFFRKVAHVQYFDRQEVMSDHIRGDSFIWSEPRAETLKSVGVDPSEAAKR